VERIWELNPLFSVPTTIAGTEKTGGVGEVPAAFLKKAAYVDLVGSAK
jgi:hypothetical protein